MSDKIYEHPRVMYRLTEPGDAPTPAAQPDLYPTPYEAWRAAAARVIDHELAQGDAGYVRIARELLDCNDTGQTWGWQVTRWAITRRVQVLMHKSLGPAWSGALSINGGGGGLPGTFGVLAEALITDLLQDGRPDVVVTDGGEMMIGIAAGVDRGEVVFVDGSSTHDMGGFSSIVATFGAL